ncbi:MAG: hypothetical protein KAS32_24825 [Candidatus Peribacteraceae bacterium]|nr:hypothetical protein [Candidatus Peribacteraceae bacterium]
MDGKIKEIYDEMIERKRLIDKRTKAKAKRTVKHKRKRPVKPSLLSRQPHLPFDLKGMRPEAFNQAIERKKGKPLSDIHKLRISKSLRASYRVISPSGKEYIVSNLKKFSFEKALNYKCMLDVSRQRLHQHNGGWLCFKIENNKNY